jgi:hypothetical protein
VVDLADEEQARRALSGAHAVVNLVGIAREERGGQSCQSACNRNPGSASKKDPPTAVFGRHGRRGGRRMEPLVKERGAPVLRRVS